MIRANELRIGNWYYKLDACIVPGEGIEYNKRYKKITGDDIQHLDENPDDTTYHPIPFTSEILEWIGFKKKEDGDVEEIGITYKLSIPVKGENVNEIFFFISAMKEVSSFGAATVNGYWASNNFTYLHEFQNLYYSLVGKEIQVNVKTIPSK